MLCTCEKDNTEVRSFNCYLDPVHSIARGSSWELELKFLSVSWHCRHCFELHHRIVLGRRMKGHRSPFMVSYGIFYKIKLRWRTNNSSTLHTEETLITCCFKASNSVYYICFLFNHYSKGAAGTNRRYFIGFFFYGVSKTEVKTKFVNTSNRGRNCLFSKNETTILVMQNVQFEFPEFRQVSLSFSLAVRTSTVAIASPQTSFGVRLSRIHFSPTSDTGEKWMRDKRTPKDVCGEATVATAS